MFDVQIRIYGDLSWSSHRAGDGEQILFHHGTKHTLAKYLRHLRVTGWSIVSISAPNDAKNPFAHTAFANVRFSISAPH